MKGIKFVTRDRTKFVRTLNKRVNNYFKENNLKKTGNWKLYSKAVFMFSVFILPLIALLTFDLPTWGQNTADHYHGNRNGRCWYEYHARRQSRIVFE